VLNLLEELKQAFGLTYIFISHDLHVIRHVCDRVLVMYLGQVVELGPVDEVFASPRHPYTRALIRSVPSGDPEARMAQAPLSGDPPNPIDPPSGCRFHPRCPEAQDACAQQAPRFIVNREGHGAACLRWLPASVPSAPPSPRQGAERVEVAHG
jgi:peptide/nickel transport system ATP-binding protein